MHRLTPFLVTLLPLVGNPALAADLRVSVAGLVNGEAPVYLALYDNAESFSRMNGMRLAVVKQWTEQPSVAFTDLPPGEYVVAAFQDINGNGELDTNLLGQPTEPFALSRGAVGNMGPPRFEDAAIALEDNGKSIIIELGN